MTEERRLRIPEDLTLEEERAILVALERYLHPERPRPKPWALAARMDALGIGALQARKLAEGAWRTGGAFARRGVPSLHGRADAH